MKDACTTKKGQILLAGDINATATYSKRFGMGIEDKTADANENGTLWADFVLANKMTILNFGFDFQ